LIQSCYAVISVANRRQNTLHPEDLVQVVDDDPAHFQGVDGEPQRRRLLEHWLATDFTTSIKAGMGHSGKQRIANLKPIHMSTIKLLDPRVRSQDRDLSQFLYNVFRDTDLIIGEGSFAPTSVPWSTECRGKAWRLPRNS